jgi:hypothetical protein
MLSTHREHPMKSKPRRHPPPHHAPLLPHEHDEAPESGAPAQPVIRRAARDIAKGLVDTDNYTRATTITRHALRTRTSSR